MPLVFPFSWSRAKHTYRLRPFTTSAHLKKMLVDLSSATETTNQHISVGPDGKVNVDLSFTEEPLGVPAEEGYGWPQLEFNETIGPGNRYMILRKLGWGMSSSSWLARDHQENSHVAIKILNGYMTDLEKRGLVWERRALDQLSSPSPSAHCLKLLSNFTIPGKGSAGEHLCLVTQLLGGDVNSLHDKHSTVFPFPLAKRILLHLLRGIAHAHSRDVVHTDLKHDNIFFDTCMSTEALDEFLASDPPRRHPPEVSVDGKVRAAVSQPLPIPTLQDALKRTYVLADFGSSQPIIVHTADEITTPALRPPEIMIGGPWNEKVDIWSFGCLVFELVIGRRLFKYEPYEKYGLDEDSNILYQMMCYTCESFEPEQLTASSLAANFFNPTCDLIPKPPMLDYPFEISIRSYEILQEEDVLSTAAFMRRCLRLDPTQRASAADLLSDPWFSGVD
ncbi:kinase-like domain-containing protein [Infundibulicybe gibba]|nr:kinase-like domain-containing protein [Infundibulicybe gibba]